MGSIRFTTFAATIAFSLGTAGLGWSDIVPVDLTITELKLITALMENPDVIHSRSELLNVVWGYADDSQSRTLDTHIKRLREKLGDHGRHIGTVRGQGYLFHTTVPVEQMA